MSRLRRMLPSLNALGVFDAAVRCGTFARAASELGVTSPAVSRTIGRLEDHLGRALFRRTPTGVVLTEDGNMLFSEVSKSLACIENAVGALVERERTGRRPIVLSVSTAFATHWFMPRLARFQDCFPGEEIQFQLINGPLQGSVAGVDIAMRFDPLPDRHHDVYALMPELLVPVCAPRAQCSGNTCADRTIRLSGSPFDWSAMFKAGLTGTDAQEVLFSDYTLVVQAALMGQGKAVGWLNVVSNLLVEGTLVPTTATAVPTGRRCDLVTHRGGRHGVVNEICDWMLSEYRRDVSTLNERYPGFGISLA